MDSPFFHRLFEGMQWWTPIPWLIGLAGLAAAIFAIRRSRIPSVRLNYVSAVGMASPPDFDEIIHFVVDILCTGADIHDPTLWLECYYAKSRERSYWPEVLALRFSRTEPSPNPLKNGQVMRFELVDTHLRKALELNSGYDRIPSDLWPHRVWVVLYSSGDRVVARFSKWRFRRELRTFDSLSTGHVRVGKEQEGWSHQYTQEEDSGHT